MESTLITHRLNTLDVDLADCREQLQRKPSLALPLDDELALLDELATFELGRFLLSNKGLNGFWTAYIINHAEYDENRSALENWLLLNAPAIKATRERFHIFKRLLEAYVAPGMTVASIPCGVMDDLLTLKADAIHRVGIDLDPQSIALATENAHARGLPAPVFYQRDAWALDFHHEFDVLTSNGLNIYAKHKDDVAVLYQRFFEALKPGGHLVTSFLTPPPALDADSPWRHYDAADVLKQKALFIDIIGVSWQQFSTESETRQQLLDAGFADVQFFSDTQGIFPTVLAKKA